MNRGLREQDACMKRIAKTKTPRHEPWRFEQGCLYGCLVGSRMT
jgi:hypothetical protein